MSIELPNIFEYFDYHKYLRDCYEHLRRESNWFSYRYIKEKTGVDPGYMVKVFQGKKHLSQKSVPKFSTMLKLNKRKSEYLNLMVLFAKAKNNEDTTLYFEKMLSYREIGAHQIETKHYEYYTKWYHAAVRNILAYYQFDGDFEKLGQMVIPEISGSEAKKSVKLLTSIGFIKKVNLVNGKTSYQLDKGFLTTGKKWNSIAIRKFQKDTINLAQRALDHIDKEKRDISTVTITLSTDGLTKAKEIINNFRKQIMELANQETDPNGAYHMNLQLFPIGKKLEGK